MASEALDGVKLQKRSKDRKKLKVRNWGVKDVEGKNKDKRLVRNDVFMETRQVEFRKDLREPWSRLLPLELADLFV
jgi:hypothetical protein